MSRALGRWLGWAEARLAPLAGDRRVVLARRVVERYDSVRGGLLAAGLAYGALFSILTGLLFFVGVVGLFVDSAEAVERLIAVLSLGGTPFEVISRDALVAASRGALPMSLVGMAGLAWSGSRLYGALDGAFGLFFPEAPSRSIIRRNAEALGFIVALTAVLVLALGTSGVASFMGQLQAIRGLEGLPDRLVWLVVAGVVWIVATVVLYRVLPRRSIRLQVLLPPAVVVGTVIAVVTLLFAYLTPQFLGSLQLYGPIAAFLTAVIWLAIVSQAILLGASWLSVQTDPDLGAEGASPSGPISPGDSRSGDRTGPRPTAADHS